MLTDLVTFVSSYTGYGLVAFHMLLMQIFFMVICGIVGAFIIIVAHNYYYSSVYWMKGDCWKLFKSSAVVISLGIVIILIVIILNLEMK